MYRSLEAASAALGSGATTARALAEEALARIAAPSGEGARAFVAVQAEAALAAADAMDALRRAGRAPSRWAGIPISVKDLYDQRGVVTRAGSVALDDAAPAARTAPAVARLERAGFVVLGRTNMTEFAFSGLGVNPHFGTPRAPWDRATGRLPGGSSSGAAVAVADGMGLAGLGSDTGGSCRIPAALCGVVGWKPTARRVPLAGTVPLSHTLDSLGPLANTAACCAVLDSLMSGESEEGEAPSPAPLAGARLGVPRASYLFNDVEDAVARAFGAALRALEAAGARVEDVALPGLAAIPAGAARYGTFAAAEAWAWHAPLLARRGGDYDPRVRVRIERGAGMSAADYLGLSAERARVVASAWGAAGGYDALLCPTVPMLPPPLAAVGPEDEYGRINLALLRNPTAGNFLDGCSISLPCHAPGEGPVGLMLTARGGADRRLFALARGAEAALAARG